MPEGSSEYSVGKSRTRDAAAGTGVREGCSGQEHAIIQHDWQGGM